jgi:TonB-linked SusC/RagA family outer membrane protein
MKKIKPFHECNFSCLTKTFRIMRVTLFFVLAAILQTVANEAYSQKTKLSLDYTNTRLEVVLDEIENLSEFFFLANEKLVDLDRNVSVSVKNKKIDEILDVLFAGTDVVYTITDRKIILAPSFLSEVAQQQLTVSGTVTNEAGEPLPGVTVVLKGTTQGTVTNADGNYSLNNIPEDAILVFSFVGMRTQEIEVGSQTSIDVEMLIDAIGIEEVVAIGYGTQKKANLTGSVSTVSIEDIEKRPVSNSISALQGKVTGLRVNQARGMPGQEGVTLELRGASSWGTNSLPLVLVDGVVGTLSNLPITDIESISVLKDAASASIYGSRAANGVILVTTKQGKTGKPTLSYNMMIGGQSATDTPDQIWNSAQFMTLFNKAVERGAMPATPYPQHIIDLYSDPNRDKNLYPDFNWTDAVWRTALIQEHHIGLNGGTENFKYNISGGFLDQDGALRWHWYKRYNGLVNLSATVNKYISVGTNISYTYGNTRTPDVFDHDFILMYMTQNPMVKPYLPDGSGRYSDRAIPTALGGFYVNRNPFWIGKETYRNNKNWQANIQGWIDINLLQSEDMSLKWSTKYASGFAQEFNVRYSYGLPPPNYYYLKESDFLPGGRDEWVPGEMWGMNTDLVNADYRTLLNTLYSTLTWNWTVNNHNISAMNGYSQESSNYRWLTGWRNEFPVQNMFELDGMGSTNQTNSGGMTEWAFQSFFGRVTYDFKNKYLFEANYRYDGSSRIFKSNRWGFFPSASGAWRISEEDFIKNSITWIDNLKLRISYGLLGNANIGDYPYQDTYSTTSYVFNDNQEQGIAQTSFKNKSLKWEKTKVTNLGIDFNIKDDIVYGTIDLYNKYTSGILAPASIPVSAGMGAPTVNYGEFKNYGIEFEIGHSNKIGELKYNLNAQVSINRNKVMKYPAPVYLDNRIIEEGKPYFDYYMYEYIGIFKSQAELDAVETPGNPQLGDIRFKDQNNDGKIDAEDKIRVKGAYPDFIYSFGANLEWRNFDLSMFFQGVKGLKYHLRDAGVFPFWLTASPNPKFLDAYDPITNPDSNIPSIYSGHGYPAMLGGTAQNSTYYLFDHSYLRLKNLQIGYNLPESILQKLGIGQLRVYLGGDNLLTFTKVFDGDPEREGDGRFSTYPNIKTLSIGLNVKF